MTKPATHMQEPWIYETDSAPGGYRVLTKVGEFVVAKASFRANARRIVACVNALAGFGTEEIESGKIP